MKIIYLFFLLWLFGCSNTPNDVFDVARYGKVSNMQVLIKDNLEIINTKNKSGYTPLILSVYRGNDTMVPFLLKNGAHINESSGLGTALMAASYKNNTEIAKILIDNGADVNLSDSKGTTALHYACFHQNIELVKLLMAKHANPNKKDKNHKTPLDFAIDNNNIEIIKLLNTH